MKSPRIVLDTNVLISALLFGGKPRQILEQIVQGHLTGLTSLPILTELQDALLRPKFGFAPEAVVQILDQIHTTFELVTIQRRLKVIAQDPDDDMILECAVEGKADFIVSGDNHLLSLHSFENILVVDAATILESTNR